MNHSIDLGAFPLVVITVTGPLTLKEAQIMYGAFEELLDRPEHFAIAMISNNEAQGEKEAQRYMNSWVKAHKPIISQRCAGMALVTQSSKFIAIYKPIAGIVINKMYGCPGKLFTDLDEATQWLNGQLTAMQVA